MFVHTRTWDNRNSRRINGRLNMTGGRSWSRRIQWLENQEGQVKLKFEVGDSYREELIPEGFAQIVWDRFKAGQSVEDCISIFALHLPVSMASKRGRGL